MRNSVSLQHLFWSFFKIGCVAFGGFMALISVVEKIIVKKEKLLQHEDMLDGISLANLMPGPQAVNVVVYVGYKCHGIMGALVSAIGVLLPTLLLMIVFTHIYFSYGNLPFISQFFQGFTPAVTAIILSVVWSMAKKNITSVVELCFALFAALLIIMYQNIYVNIFVILLGGIIGYILFKNNFKQNNTNINIKLPIKQIILSITFVLCLVILSLLPLPLDENSLEKLTLTFSGLSVMLFGGGYVFIPMIQNVVVENHQWLTQQAFIDGIAIGQVTPGPIMISAAFIGQKVMTEQYGLGMGIIGAIVSTISIFTPPAILMLSAAKILDWLKQSANMQAALLGIRCVVIGMIFSAAFVFGLSALPSFPETSLVDVIFLGSFWKIMLPTLLIFSLSLVALIKYQLEVIWVIPTAGILGVLLY